jgi:hypothetical protein
MSKLRRTFPRRVEDWGIKHPLRGSVLPWIQHGHKIETWCRHLSFLVPVALARRIPSSRHHEVQSEPDAKTLPAKVPTILPPLAPLWEQILLPSYLYKVQRFPNRILMRMD